MKQELNAGFWNNKYLSGEEGWDLGSISPPLKAYFDQLKSKDLRILIPGAGNAYEAEYLVQQGFTNVFVCDYAETALRNLKKRYPDFPSSHLIQNDFFKLQEGGFDLIVEQTFFCALNPSLRKAYFEKMAVLLVPGGRLAGLLFNDALNSDKPPFGGNEQEYRSLISGLLNIVRLEPCYNSVKPRAGRELFMILEKPAARNAASSRP